MHCPYCEAEDTRVVDSRSAEGGRSVRRRRSCPVCGNRFTTFERSEAAVVVLKRDGRREPFEVGKVLAGIEMAVAHRQVSGRAAEALARDIEAQVQEAGPEVTSEEIGRMVLAGLQDLDEAAYLRFAAVYKEFEGADDFEREVAALEGNARRGSAG